MTAILTDALTAGIIDKVTADLTATLTVTLTFLLTVTLVVKPTVPPPYTLASILVVSRFVELAYVSTVAVTKTLAV